MDYQKALDYILSFADFERAPRSALVFDLRRIQLLLGRLGDPHLAAKAVHVAGTKGKGSTAAMMASVLTQSGYLTGLYTSPHLLSFTERVQIDGRPIAEADFARLTGALKPHVATINREAAFGELTTFELLTALAFLYFSRSRADYQVMETGLGGRLDATNVVSPEVAVITSISYDHMDVLGDTLAQIAGEKAGIIKPGRPLVCAPQSPEAMAVIERVCHERGARLVRVGTDVTWRRLSHSPEGQTFALQGLASSYKLKIPLLGEHQLENAATAVAAVEVLVELGAQVTPQGIARGLEQVHWPGRLQVLRRQPWVIIDGAHNAYSARRLAEALRQYFTFERTFLIFGASSDKQVAGMADELAPLADRVIVTRSRHPRAVAPAALADEFARAGKTAEIADGVGTALALALSRAAPGDLICATGSIFVIAEVLEYFKTAPMA